MTFGGADWWALLAHFLAMSMLAAEYHGAVAMALHGLTAPPFWLALAGFGLATWFYLVDPGMPARIRGFTGWAINMPGRA